MTTPRTTSMLYVSRASTGQQVEWQKTGRGRDARQRGVVVDVIPEGVTGREVFDSLIERVQAANARLAEQGKAPLSVNLGELQIARRHLSFALDTVETERVLVMAPHESGASWKRRWFCPNVHAVVLA